LVFEGELVVAVAGLVFFGRKADAAVVGVTDGADKLGKPLPFAFVAGFGLRGEGLLELEGMVLFA
jgi:hypothetical protein